MCFTNAVGTSGRRSLSTTGTAGCYCGRHQSFDGSCRAEGLVYIIFAEPADYSTGVVAGEHRANLALLELSKRSGIPLMQNFTVVDMEQITLATLAFALFFLPTGYLLCLASNVFSMRSRSAVEKMLFSTAFSFAATPILAVILTRISSFRFTLAVFLLFAVVSISTLIRQFPLPAGFFSGIRRSTWVLFGMMLAWFLLVQFSLADLQIGHRLYTSFVAFDHSVRVPFVEAAARSGVPPLNPFYGLGKIPVLRYFYYWYVVCAMPMQLFSLSAKACLDASVFWSGLGLASTIPLFLKYFFGETEHLRRKSVIGIALLAVTGLDLLPYAVQVYRYRTLNPDMEWWDPNQVTSWLGSLLWVPHHVASLTACMVCLLVLSTIDEDNSTCQTIRAVVLSGLALASAAGLSVYVTFSFAVFAILWALQTLRQKRMKTFIAYIATGVFSLLLSWPYLLDLLSKRGNAGGGAADGERFAYFAFRDYPEGLELLGKLGLHNHLLLELAKLPILLFVYALEFGFFALIMVLCLRQDRTNSFPLNRQRRMAWMMFTVCLLTLSIVKSDTSGSNDLGFRGMLVAQFVLLIWAAPIVHDVFLNRDAAVRSGLGAPWIKISLICTLVLGVSGTTYQFLALRCYAPLVDAGKVESTRMSEFVFGTPGFGERTYWLREGFRRLNESTSSHTLVQYNPVRDEVLITHLYSTRQAAVGDPSCGSAFGGDFEKCRQAFPYFARIFNAPDVVRAWDLDSFCDDFRVNVLVATDTDPVWNDPDSWVWTRPILLANPSMRALSCGTSVLPSRR